MKKPPGPVRAVFLCLPGIQISTGINIQSVFSNTNNIGRGKTKIIPNLNPT